MLLPRFSLVITKVRNTEEKLIRMPSEFSFPVGTHLEPFSHLDLRPDVHVSCTFNYLGTTTYVLFL